nr:hypothetical protein Hi04_10k_c554_00017 [uncultured bacterium]
MRSMLLAVPLSLVCVISSLAQETGMPSFDAPYRAFTAHEAGALLSFPTAGGTALEGEYRYGHKTLDFGLRGGFWSPGSGATTEVLLGGEVRERMLTHNNDFPLDGAIAVGLGLNLVSNFNTVIIPAGLSLGRRIDVKNSPVSIIPYGEPVVFLTAGSNQTTTLHFALGLGGDFRLSPAFEVRVSGGLGDIKGVSIGAVWIK